MRTVALVLFLLVSIQHGHSQSQKISPFFYVGFQNKDLILRGRVVTSDSTESVPFAPVRVWMDRRKVRDTYSDLDGYYRITLNQKDIYDSLSVFEIWVDDWLGNKLLATGTFNQLIEKYQSPKPTGIVMGPRR